MARRNKSTAVKNNVLAQARIENLSHDGRGVTHIDGKAVFVEGALAGEEVVFRYTGFHKDFATAEVVEVLQASEHRVQPRCAHAAICGGCSLQHIASSEQIHIKHQLLQEHMRRIGKTQPDVWLEPLQADFWGYRRKARLGVKFVRKKERVLVGFREKNAPFLAELERCEVLHPSVGERLTDLADVVRSLTIYDQIPQIEVAVGDAQVALVVRHLKPFAEADLAALAQFGTANDFAIYLQPKGPNTVHPLNPGTPSLFYQLPDYDLTLQFAPTDFTQVNAQINQRMLQRALQLLELCEDDIVLDLFCGLGNFSLPIARTVREVVGVEGDPGLIARAKENAAYNQISNAQFFSADLTQDPSAMPWCQRSYDKLLLDPPRTGAKELIPYVASLGASRIVYVSCNPSTLARDTHTLVSEHGYHLQSAGVMDMFPHTTHVESIALFVR